VPYWLKKTDSPKNTSVQNHIPADSFDGSDVPHAKTKEP
jgi:hypothetical protein